MHRFPGRVYLISENLTASCATFTIDNLQLNEGNWYFCVRLLLEAGANLNCVNSWQTTCLAAAFLKGHYGLCDYLLTDYHVDINFKTDEGLTLVMLTVGLQISLSSQQQLDYVVTKHKADCTMTDGNGNNAVRCFIIICLSTVLLIIYLLSSLFSYTI